jgi:17beta-estradiol 17-dehydrogenase / very-long-chain 3-oxoacyl-CoA reductase
LSRSDLLRYGRLPQSSFHQGATDGNMWPFGSSAQSILAGNEPNAKNWALITGATSGIGYGIAHQLGQRGFNLIIHGRDAGRLQYAKEHLEASLAGAVEIKVLQLDANSTFHLDGSIDPAAQESLAGLSDLGLRVLVNNVGMGHNPASDFQALAQQSPEKVSRILNTNIVFMTYLTRLLLPVFNRNAKPASNASTPTSPPSLVINCCSLAEIGLPWMTVYSATKAYMTAFSKALDTEMKGNGWAVRVIASVIGDTDSPGHQVGTNLFTPDSDDMARMVIESADKSTSVVQCPFWGHWLQWVLCMCQPHWLLQLGTIQNLKGTRQPDLKED